MRAETFKTVSVLDPLLDTESISVAEIVEFAKSRDYALVDGKWKPGDKPTIFHCREISHDLMEKYVKSVSGSKDEAEEETYRRAFECGVYLAENVVGNDGVNLDRWEPAKKRNGKPMMSAEESYRFSWNERQEIGAVVYAHSFLHRKIALCCQLPSSVLALLGHREYRHADPSPTTALAPSNETPSPDIVEALPTPA